MLPTARRRAAAGLSAVLLLAACGGDDADPVGAVDAGETNAAATDEPAATDTDDEPDEGSTGEEEPANTDDDDERELRIEPPEPLPIEPPEGMELVWSDEFDGDAVNLDNWTYDIGGWGWGNGESQYYTDRPKNARVVDGLLVIELHQEKFDGSFYTSARLKTQGLQEFQYGYLEARIKVPKGSGTWPAFWMLGASFDKDATDPAKQWPNVGEIDIMEYVGREPDLVLGTVHGPGYAGAGGLTRWNRQDEDVGDDFRLFAIDWDETGIRFLYEGEEYYEVTPELVGPNREYVFDQPFFFILNLALGGTLGGNIALDLEYPIQYYVDHVRVYQDVEA